MWRNFNYLNTDGIRIFGKYMFLVSFLYIILVTFFLKLQIERIPLISKLNKNDVTTLEIKSYTDVNIIFYGNTNANLSLTKIN